jgi:hypothetical protein
MPFARARRAALGRFGAPLFKFPDQFPHGRLIGAEIFGLAVHARCDCGHQFLAMLREQIFRNELLFHHEISHEETLEKLCCLVRVGQVHPGKDLQREAECANPHREGESLMRNRQHTLLAGVAALALFAASGMALAQQTQQDQKGAGSAAQSNMQGQRGEKGTKNQAASQGLKNQGAQQGKNESAMSKQPSGQNARTESKMQSKQTGAAADMTGKSNAGKGEKSFNRSAQQLKQNKGASTANRESRQTQLNAQSKSTQSKTGQFANQQNRTQRGATSAQRNEQFQGLQGSTRAPLQGATSTEQRSGGAANVSLNEQQRTQIRETVINSRGAPRVSNVDFSVNVGTVVPRRHIHLVRVPETLIRIEPRWRHYLYFVYNNEIVIVDPRSMRIVDVLPV